MKPIYQVISEDKENKGSVLFQSESLKAVYEFQKNYKGSYPSLSTVKQ